MIKRVINKFRKPKFVILSNSEKVKILSDKATGLFDQFKEANNQLEEINKDLDVIIVSEELKIENEIMSHQYRINQLINNKDRAYSEKVMNEKLQERLADFIR